jgi:hypothetical protein
MEVLSAVVSLLFDLNRERSFAVLLPACILLVAIELKPEVILLLWVWILSYLNKASSFVLRFLDSTS